MEQLLAREAPPESAATDWASAFRAANREAFADLGLPSRRNEAWKYSDLAQALNERKSENAAPMAAAPDPIAIAGADLVCFRDGALESGAALPGDVAKLAEAIAGPSEDARLLGAVYPQANHALIALNASELGEGLILHVKKGEHRETPLHVQIDWTALSTPSDRGRHVRLLVIVEDGAEATLVESHIGEPPFATLVTEIKLSAQARLNHVRLERIGPSGRLSGVTLGELQTSARYQAFYFSEGARFARHEAHLKLAGENAEAVLDGACLAAGETHCDNTIVIAHDAPNAQSRQFFRNVLGGRAHGVFQGCVKVARPAQKTDARQMCRSLLLSRKARISAKPELEIFADDVKCSHGATSGELDEQALFFLRARGIPLEEARIMLVEAFLGDGVDSIANESVREAARALTTDWLAAQASEAFHAG